MSAEALRRAAALMRERAEAATPGPWETDDDGFISSHADTMLALSTEDADGPVPDATHIASWHPAVALAVADWLENEALAGETTGRARLTLGPALAVARAYLGEQP